MAPSLEDIASAILGDAIQKEIAGQNVYYNLQSAPDTVSKYALQQVVNDPTRYKPGEIAAVSGISGLISGLLGGIGDTYQNTLTDRYAGVTLNTARGQQSSDQGGLPTSLFSSANRKGELLRLAAGQEAQKRLEANALYEKKREDSFEDYKKRLELSQFYKKPGIGEQQIENPLVKSGLAKLREAVATGGKANLTEEERQAVNDQPLAVQNVFDSLLKSTGVNTREIARSAKEEAKLDIEARKRKVPEVVFPGESSVILDEKTAQDLRDDAAQMNILSRGLENIKSGSRWSVFGTNATLEKVGGTYVEAALQDMMRTDRLTEPQRKLLRSLAPASLVRGDISQTFIDSLTVRDRETMVDLIETIVKDAYEIKVESYGGLVRGKPYSADYLRNYAEQNGATPQQIAEALGLNGR